MHNSVLGNSKQRRSELVLRSNLIPEKTYCVGWDAKTSSLHFLLDQSKRQHYRTPHTQITKKNLKNLLNMTWTS